MQQQREQQPNAEQQVQNITEINANIEKMKTLMQNRTIPTTTTSLIKKVGAAAAVTNANDKDDEDDGVVKYTRDGLDQLMEQRPALKLSTSDASDDGYFNKLFFMFQIYIAFINALTSYI